MSWRRERLRGIVRRLRTNPLTQDELEAVRAELAQSDALIASLDTVVQREKADLDHLERPLIRLGLWLRGSLDEAEAKERAEYEAALHALMNRASEADRIQQGLARLGAVVELHDADVASAFALLRARDLDEWPELRLTPLFADTQRAAELEKSVALCRTLLSILGRRPTRHFQREVRNLARRIQHPLKRLSLPELAAALEPLPTENTTRDLDTVRQVRATLESEGRAVVDGLALRLRREVRRDLESRADLHL